LEAIDPVGLGMEVDDGVCYLVQLFVRQRETRNLHREQGSAPNQPGSRSSDAGHQIERRCKRVFLVFLHPGKEAVGQEVGPVTPALQRYASVPEALGEPLILGHDPVSLVLIHHLDHAPGQHLHGAAGHAPVGVESLEHHDLIHELLVVVGIVSGQKAPGVGLRVLSPIEQEHVRCLRDVLHDLGDGSVRLAIFVLLDIPGVFNDPGPVHHQPNAVVIGERPSLPEVGQGERVLPVGKGLDEEEGDLPPLQCGFQSRPAHVPGEDGRPFISDVGSLHLPRRQEPSHPAGVGGYRGALGDHRGDGQLDGTQNVVRRA
jgi:hypothetical protein